MRIARTTRDRRRLGVLQRRLPVRPGRLPSRPGDLLIPRARPWLASSVCRPSPCPAGGGYLWQAGRWDAGRKALDAGSRRRVRSGRNRALKAQDLYDATRPVANPARTRAHRRRRPAPMVIAAEVRSCALIPSGGRPRPGASRPDSSRSSAVTAAIAAGSCDRRLAPRPIWRWPAGPATKRRARRRQRGGRRRARRELLRAGDRRISTATTCEQPGVTEAEARAPPVRATPPRGRGPGCMGVRDGSSSRRMPVTAEPRPCSRQAASGRMRPTTCAGRRRRAFAGCRAARAHELDLAARARDRPDGACRRPATRCLPSPLTRREREVLALLAEGRPTARSPTSCSSARAPPASTCRTSWASSG